jgi:CRP-like cAMP-binding protein
MIRNEMASVPEKPTVISVLEACSMFNPLSQAEREQMAAQSHMAYAQRGESIWLAGTSSEFFAISGTGFVKMTSTSPQGSEIAVELLGPGQCFGLLAALEGRIFPLSAIAVTNCWYLKVPTRTFLDVYNANDRLRDQILRSLSPRLRRAHNMMAKLTSGSVEQRVATVLSILMESYGRTGKLGGVRLTVPLTRQDIAEMAGTTVETCIRIMSKWQKSGMISTEQQVITIRRPEELHQALAE